MFRLIELALRRYSYWGMFRLFSMTWWSGNFHGFLKLIEFEKPAKIISSPHPIWWWNFPHFAQYIGHWVWAAWERTELIPDPIKFSILHTVILSIIRCESAVFRARLSTQCLPYVSMLYTENLSFLSFFSLSFLSLSFPQISSIKTITVPWRI